MFGDFFQPLSEPVEKSVVIIPFFLIVMLAGAVASYYSDNLVVIILSSIKHAQPSQDEYSNRLKIVLSLKHFKY